MKLRAAVAQVQDRIALLLGLAPGRRTEIVRGMLRRPTGDSAGYWLQIVIASVLATLGLALDSTAVVIGAMLIAPLMRPIVELAMGLATGSAPLVFRAGWRAIASVVLVTGASAAFTLLLPFHEVTRELLARTAPSLLDLFVAGACALAGAYAVVITSSDVATTAAGTSIGISLVPPLCTAGYALSIQNWQMARGAALLFTANFTGIITVAGVVFVLTGFGQVDIRGEVRTLDPASFGAASRLGARVSYRTDRLGPLSRLLLPLALLGAIAVPLSRAVDDIARRSTIRQQVAQLLDHSDRVVQYFLDPTATPLLLRVVVVGSDRDARELVQQLRAHLDGLGARGARIAVWAVPDAADLDQLSERLDEIPLQAPPAPPPAPPPPPALDARLRTAWPTVGGRQLVDLWISEGPPLRARATHLGPPLGAAGLELLARAADESTLAIEETALAPVTAPAADAKAWTEAATQLVAAARDVAAVKLCVTVPPVRRREAADVKRAREWVTRELVGRAEVTLTEGTDWTVVPTTTTCAPAAATPPPPKP